MSNGSLATLLWLPLWLLLILHVILQQAQGFSNTRHYAHTRSRGVHTTHRGMNTFRSTSLSSISTSASASISSSSSSSPTILDKENERSKESVVPAEQKQMEMENTNNSDEPNENMNTETYNSILNALQDQDQDETTTSSSSSSTTSSTTSSSSTTTITAPEKAEQILQTMTSNYQNGTNKSCLPNTQTYNIVMKLWSQSGRTDAGENAERVLRSMWDVHDSYKRDDQQQQQQEKQSQQQSQHKSNVRVLPDQFSYSTVISAWARSGLGTHAAEKSEVLLREMHRYSRMGYENLCPNTWVVNAVCNAWGKFK